MTKLRQFVFQPAMLGQMPSSVSAQVDRLFGSTDEQALRPLVVRSASVPGAGEAREGAAFFVPVPAAQVMGVMWMAPMYLNRPGRGGRECHRHRAGEGKQAQAYPDAELPCA